MGERDLACSHAARIQYTAGTGPPEPIHPVRPAPPRAHATPREEAESLDLTGDDEAALAEEFAHVAELVDQL